VTRHDQERIEIGERLQHKAALVEPWVRHREPRLVDHDPVDEQQVEVDRPRTKARAVAGAPECQLDAEQGHEELGRRKGRLELRRRVQEGRLLEVAHRLGLAKRGHRSDAYAVEAVEQRDRCAERRLAVADVRAKPDKCPRHNRILIALPASTIAAGHTTPAMRVTLAAALPAAVVLPFGAGSAGATASATLVELTPAAACSGAVVLARAGASPVAPSLGLYRLSSAAAERVLPLLRRHGAVRLAVPDRAVGRLARLDFSDPLVPTEWWRQAVKVDTLTPPPAGKPVTIVDSGIDVTHPEFLGRPGTETLDAQEPAGIGGEHGTAVASLIGAPANGLGLVGIYPEALLRSWDAAQGAGTELDTSSIVQGILAAAAAGPGVINLSLGSSERELPIEQAIDKAVSEGTLVVAASGNDGDTSNQLTYPASLPHVLTVGATGRDGHVAPFSSRSRFVDLAAPGEEMPIATAIGKGFTTGDGTSFAAPLVSGAAAWVWTARPDLDASQLFEVMRRSAQDIESPGRDDATGFGLLDVPAALAYPAPVRDPLEPNDDVEFVRPGGLYADSTTPLTSKTHRRTTVQARITTSDDPRDVYRVWLPKQGTLTATATADTDVDLGLWKLGTTSVIERRVATDRLAQAATAGSGEKLVYRNTGAGSFAYLAVTFPRGVRDAVYTMRVSS
jgi:subtilisin family serine protease